MRLGAHKSMLRIKNKSKINLKGVRLYVSQLFIIDFLKHIIFCIHTFYLYDQTPEQHLKLHTLKGICLETYQFQSKDEGIATNNNLIVICQSKGGKLVFSFLDDIFGCVYVTYLMHSC